MVVHIAAVVSVIQIKIKKETVVHNAASLFPKFYG
jgi:hypothetical protein